MVSKPISPRAIWYGGIAVWFGSLFLYAKYTPVIDLTVIIVYIVIILFWIWLPMFIMHWYSWSK